jgi:hypothetical protein
MENKSIPEQEVSEEIGQIFWCEATLSEQPKFVFSIGHFPRLLHKEQ